MYNHSYETGIFASESSASSTSDEDDEDDDIIPDSPKPVEYDNKFSSKYRFIVMPLMKLLKAFWPFDDEFKKKNIIFKILTAVKVAMQGRSCKK